MGSIVGIVIAEVTDQEKSKKRMNKSFANDEVKPTIEHCQENDRGDWRHYQAGGVLGLMVMNAMEQKHQPFSQFAFRREVKDKTVKGVFDK